MSSKTLTPSKAQKNLWFLQLVLTTVIILVLFVLPFSMFSSSASGTFLLIFAVFWLIIAALVLLYIPFFFRSLRYEIDTYEIRVAKGVFWKQRVTIPYTKVTNIDISQGPFERLFGISRIKVQTAGYGGNEGSKAEQVLLGLTAPDTVRDVLMKRINVERQPTVESSATDASDQSLLSSIHDELKAIRTLLESRNS